MKKLEIIRAIVEMISLNILDSSNGYRLIEKVINTNKYGIHKEESKEPLEFKEQTELQEIKNEN